MELGATTRSGRRSVQDPAVVRNMLISVGPVRSTMRRADVKQDLTIYPGYPTVSSTPSRLSSPTPCGGRPNSCGATRRVLDER
jgi:hypothetical protein